MMSYLTDDELQLASRFLFLSMTIIVIEKDLKTVHNGPFKLKRPYIEILERMHTKALAERRQLRQKMNQSQIKVTLLQKDELFSTFLFVGKTKEEQRNYFNPSIKKRVQSIFWDLLRETVAGSEDDLVGI